MSNDENKEATRNGAKTTNTAIDPEANEQEPKHRNSRRRAPVKAPAKKRPPAGRREAATPHADKAAAPARPKAPQKRPAAFPVVGIGASAGGLEVYTEILKALPLDTGMAFILIQHLDPTHASMLSQLLSKATRMPVFEIHDGIEVEPDCIYVIPPNAALGMEGNVIKVLPRVHTPIDPFLQSLAAEKGPLAVGVLLSGVGSDGVKGLQAIQAEGGITFVQDPETAKYDGMPRSAVQAGAADHVLPHEEIARELARLAHALPRKPQPAKKPRQKQAPEDEEDKHFQKILERLSQATGIDFPHYKRNTLRRRITRRQTVCHLPKLADYEQHLAAHPEEMKLLSEDILIQVTSFFRDPESLDALAQEAFPELVKKTQAGEPIRLWVPGCSTGEEVYSLAMLLLEYLERERRELTIQIFGSDVSEAVIQKARQGRYPTQIRKNVSEERLRRFFLRTESGLYQVNKSVRELCVFVRHDVTRDPPFSRLNLISCRNVLIYLGQELHKKALQTFHYGLRPDGFLFLGRSESASGFTQLFRLLDKKNKIYQKVFTEKPPTLGFFLPRRERPHPAKTAPNEEKNLTVFRQADHLLLSRFAPPGVVVNEKLQIVQFRGRTGTFLEPPSGAPEMGLLRMAREGLLGDLRLALKQAREQERPVRRQNVKVRGNGESSTIHLEVIPLKLTPNAKERYFLILFEPAAKAPSGKPRRRATPEEERAEVERLREDLQASQAHLHSFVEEYESTNEELQSTNEEFLSTNEELQSTNEELETAKEELQSANEELQTVNEELSMRNQEINQANDDLVNLLTSVDIGIAMVDSQRRIRRFTPRAEKLLNIIPGDIGRPLDNVKPAIDAPEMETLLAKSIEDGAIQEREVRDREGRYYRMQVRPYRTAENKIDGAVLSLVDVDEIKRSLKKAQEAEQAQARSEARLQAILDHSPTFIFLKDLSGRYQVVNRSALAPLGLTPEDLMGRTDKEVFPKEIARMRKAHDQDAFERGSALETEEVLPGHEGPRTFLTVRFPLFEAKGEPYALGGMSVDITERKRAEDLLQFLSEASISLGGSLDQEEILSRAARLVVPRLADWCTLLLDGPPKAHLTVAHRETHHEESLRQVLGGAFREPKGVRLIDEVLQTGRARLVDEVDEEILQALAASPEHKERLREVGVRSLLCIPIPGQEGTRGVAVFVLGTRRFEPLDLTVAEDLGRRIGSALENARLYRESQEAVRLRDDFLSIASHDLRTPLTTLLLHIQILTHQAQQKGDSPSLEGLGKAEAQTTRIVRMLNELLDVSRITAGQMALERKEDDLVEIAREMLERYQEEAKRAGSALTLHAERPVVALWDRARLEQVLANLVSNALKYGAGTPIEVIVEEEGDLARLIVRDHGPGIDEVSQERIFGRFERASDGRHQGGFGLGLWISRQIVEAHGGEINVRSEPKVETCFTVELPLERG